LRDNFKTNLKFNFSIYLDDTNRKGEKEVMSLWDQKYKLRFERINNTAVFCSNGNKLNTIL